MWLGSTIPSIFTHSRKSIHQPCITLLEAILDSMCQEEPIYYLSQRVSDKITDHRGFA